MSTCTKSSLADWRGMCSASRVYAANGYEISDDLQRRRVEVLEKRYGGRVEAHRAAIIIQRAFREYRLERRWRQMTSPLQRSFAELELPRGHETLRSIRPPASIMANQHYRYQTSLSAQLRADRAARAAIEGSIGMRSPPPPSPATSTTINHTIHHNTGGNRSMIDSLMSPRLVQRRLPAAGQNGMDGNNIVWVPRATLATSNPSHSNSLPRLEKHIIKDEPSPMRHPKKAMTEQERKRQYRIALNFFNKKPERGIQLLTCWGFVEESPESLAKLLFGRRGLSKQMIGEYIGTLHSQYHSCVLKYFMGLMDLRGLEVDMALKKATQFFLLPKEAEKIDKILQAFALQYTKCNPKRTAAFRGGWDTVHLISFAIIMLNTDLHTPSLKASQRMRREDFVKNMRGQDKLPGEKEGRDIDKSILEGMYERTRRDEFRPGDDHVAQVARVDSAIIGKDKPRLTETQRRLVCYCRLQQIVDPTKKQNSGSHERDVFLFNDMLVVAKAISKRRSTTSSTYNLKHWSILLGASVQQFETSQYEYGLTVVCPDRTKLHFNARNLDDRCRFVADVMESIRESCQMEDVRLELEMEKHPLRTDSQRDSGLPEMEGSNAPVAPTLRRLSFNSLDSGVVEEGYDIST